MSLSWDIECEGEVEDWWMLRRGEKGFGKEEREVVR